MKKIINYCPTGTQPTVENSLAPLYADKIIEDVHQANEIGITLVHVHARVGDANHYEAEKYAPIIEGIRKHCPNLSICVSLTGRLFPEKEKRSEVLQLHPDMASLTLSSLNFKTGPSINTPEMIYYLLEQMLNQGVIPELECFDTGMVNYASSLISDFALRAPFYFNVIFGNPFNAQCDPATIASIMHSLPKKDAVACFGGIGKQQLKSNLMGLLYANGIRIGLEDNLYLTKGQKATNHDLLLRAKRLMGELEMELMSPAEFQIKGFKNKKRNA